MPSTKGLSSGNTGSPVIPATAVVVVDSGVVVVLSGVVVVDAEMVVLVGICAGSVVDEMSATAVVSTPSVESQAASATSSAMSPMWTLHLLRIIAENLCDGVPIHPFRSENSATTVVTLEQGELREVAAEGVESPRSARHAGTMPISEAARADLYTGLAEVLGPDRAETLMAQLPRFDPSEVATKSDLAELNAGLVATRSDLSGLAAATKSDFAEVRGELRDGLKNVNQRLDRLFLTLVAGLFGVIAAMASLVLTVS